MKLHKLLFFVLIITIFSCETTKEKTDASTSEGIVTDNPFEFGVWISASKEKANEEYAKEFKKYKSAGIDEVLINTGTDPELLKRITPIATENGLKVHAWIMAMNRPGDTIALKHPEWYAVSKEGKSCYDTRPYVGYYQWLCPTREESRNHVLSLVEGLAKVDGIESVHLDYIRFSDIFLPIGLLPKYDLVQDEELPEFDFCYCDACVSKFEKIHHKNPRNIENTDIDMEWKQFRLNAVRDVVNDAYEIVHKYNKNLTAAVFPYPEMADHMVRQRWDKWTINEVYPMIYHGFYNEEVDWVGFATKQGVDDVKDKGIGVNTGVFIPAFKSVDELKQAIHLAKDNGAKGVTFFDGPAITEEYLKAIKETKESLK
ncbi:hypothetical protein MHL31_07110 [Lutibacter sp. A80]|uniref:putative glycoside hydrolase n=1 Tax=Lutibacter sp. A80 TaxID=2918453 RepID=UPI001F05C233|nr:putative glycoside hydrolase [Lutibacter sp. A80]UMB61956.1 hypothetical protein MHL31_07110 [Lutibacter sp. A80]